MKDPEFILLRNRFLIALGIVIIFAIPTFFIIKNKLLDEDSSIITSINKNKTLLIYVEEENCKNCREYKKVLSNLNVNYYPINKDKDSNYNRMLNKLKISHSDIISPALIYVEDGSLVASLVDIDNEEKIEEFIVNYNLNN